MQVEPGQSWVPGQFTALPATWNIGDGYWDNDGGALFPEEMKSRYVEVAVQDGWQLRFEVLYSNESSAPVVGYAEIDIKDLARKEHWRLLLSDPDSGGPIYGADSRSGDKQCVRPPSFLQLRTDRCATVRYRRSTFLTPKSPFYPVRSTHSGGKRVLIMTRGTRGDVQPYVALALGLVKFCNCEVTVVTELRWKGFIHAWRKKLPEELQSMLHFRPSGGDTMRQVNSALASYVLRVGHQFELLQNAAMSRTEQNFMASEGCFFHWAKEENPDYIVFGFTVTHISMIISEALNIPLVGFFLQPAREIEKAPRGETGFDAALEPLREALQTEVFNAYAMQLMQMLPEEGLTLDEMRSSRGLQPLPPGMTGDFPQYTELTSQGVPQIVPISPIVLGSKRTSTMEEQGMQLTDFIFLKEAKGRLKADVQTFIEKAHASQTYVVGMTMSSMPVGLRRILKVAVAVCQECEPLPGPNGELKRPVFIACLGGQTLDPPDEELQEEVRKLEAEGRLLAVKEGLDFAVLFPQLDAIILHGGLGVTAEALAAGIPVIVSGILLLDQRFWAKCIQDLGCGPGGSFIDGLLEEDESGRNKVASLVERALKVGTGGQQGSLPWPVQAKKIKAALDSARDPKDSEDGVTQNARIVHEAGLGAKVIRDAYAKDRDRYCCIWCFACVRWIRNLALFVGICSMLNLCISALTWCFTCCCKRGQIVYEKGKGKRALLAPPMVGREMSMRPRASAAVDFQDVRSVQRSALLSLPLTAWVSKTTEEDDDLLPDPQADARSARIELAARDQLV